MTEFFNGVLNELFAALLIGYVTDGCDALGICGNGFPCTVDIDIRSDDDGTVFGKSARNGTTDAASRAGNDDDFSFKRIRVGSDVREMLLAV